MLSGVASLALFVVLPGVPAYAGTPEPDALSVVVREPTALGGVGVSFGFSSRRRHRAGYPRFFGLGVVPVVASLTKGSALALPVPHQPV